MLSLLFVTQSALADVRIADPSGRVFGSTTTMFMPGQVLDPNDPGSQMFQAPFYEYLTLGCDDVGVKGFSVFLSGFGYAHVIDPVEGNRFDGDLLLGTLSYRSPHGLLLARVGRQIIYEGAGLNTVMDGAHLQVRPGAGIQVSAFGGLVSYPSFDLSVDHPVFGGRVAFDPWDWGRVGISYAQERDDEQAARSNLGLDYALRGLDWMDLSGTIMFDLLQKGLQETTTTLSFYPAPGWALSADYGMFSPAGRIPRTSIFSVFTDTHYHAIGGGRLGVSTFFRTFLYDDSRTGFQAGLKPVLTFTRGEFRHMAGLELSFLEGPDNGYVQARAFGMWQPLRRMELTLDVDNYIYLEKLKGYRGSHLVGATAGYEIFDGGRVQADIRTAVNPDFRHNVSGMLKFTYAFMARVR